MITSYIGATGDLDFFNSSTQTFITLRIIRNFNSPYSQCFVCYYHLRAGYHSHHYYCTCVTLKLFDPYFIESFLVSVEVYNSLNEKDPRKTNTSR